MPPTAIEIDQVSKRYRLGEDQPGRSLREAVAGRFLRITGRRPAPPPKEIWALKDVSLTMAEGEALGVIGRNGAGKSTLLKVLTRITEPTSGISRTRGRVAALLEVGTGFHPELSGRENVYLNGAILGMSRREIARRFDDIVAFSGVETFIDTPVKRYSSGMGLRLAFSVAAHLEPDIMVVDEVLAVGDAEFQAKCLGRMETAEREGRTVVFVSHNLEAIARLCPDSIWLEDGQVRERGSTGPVIDAYLSAALGGASEISLGRRSGPVVVESVSAVDELGKAAGVLRRDRPFTIEVQLSVHRRVPGLDVAIYVMNGAGVRVFDEAWSDTVRERHSEPGRFLLRLAVPPVLNVGAYRIGVWIGSAYETLLDEQVTASFRLEGSNKGRPERAVELLLSWETVSLGVEVLAPEADAF